MSGSKSESKPRIALPTPHSVIRGLRLEDGMMQQRCQPTLLVAKRHTAMHDTGKIENDTQARQVAWAASEDAGERMPR